MKINAKDRALLQELAVSFNTSYKAVMKTSEGKEHASVNKAFTVHVNILLESGADRAEIEESLGEKVKTDSPAYDKISHLITLHNAKLGIVGASGGGGGPTEQTEANEKASEAAEKAVKGVKDKPFQARYKSALDSFANTKFRLKLEKLGEKPADLLIAKAWNNSFASAKEPRNLQKLIDIANGKAVAEKPKAKSSAKETVAANKMPVANGKRNAKPEQWVKVL